ncbi:MAG: helix-turn-helix domain-containing protein [Firmicutes bacterium]|nr:helix-turn-helix domain-containing protein [Candidatus Alectryobacillus merdavium]
MANYFASNLKKIREQRGLSQNKLGTLAGVNQTTIARWENKEIAPSIDNVEDLANALNIPLPDLLGKDLRFDNATYMKPIVDDDNMVQIPVLGIIKAGIPIEAQQDILEYIEIPKTWLRGGKQFYGLKISGDSMFPKYQENDIVVFEDSRTYDPDLANNKDCAVMVNGDDATFKKVLLNDNGITLVPYNTGAYNIKMYTNEDIEKKPIRIIGIAREKRTRV